MVPKSLHFGLDTVVYRGVMKTVEDPINLVENVFSSQEALLLQSRPVAPEFCEEQAM